MKSWTRVLLTSACALALMGCASTTGRWTLKSIEPESARGEFRLESMTLMENGSFQASAEQGGQMKMMAGTYTYDPAKKQLSFNSEGKEHTYNAQLVACGGEMKVWGGPEGKHWTAVMERVGDAPKCACEGGKCTCGTAKCDPAKCDPKKCDPKTCPAAKGPAAPGAQKCDPAKCGAKTCPKAAAAQPAPPAK
ncbi:MAG: hypothetical protein AB1716_06265 [Planctomycetota bacterium]